MVQNVNAASAGNAAALAKAAQQTIKAAEKAAKAQARAEEKATRQAERAAQQAARNAAPSAQELNQIASVQRAEIAAGLYDRSLTLGEGARTLKRQDAIQAYAATIAAQEGGPSATDLRKLGRKLERAQAQIDKLQNNDRGANLSSVEAIDGRDLDIVQENLNNRINAGLRDGSLTKDEADTLLKRQQEIAAVEGKLRESGGKLTAGEQKVLLDDLRKTADAINAARRNSEGVNVATFNYADQIDRRQAALEKQLDEAIKVGSLTAEEADQVRAGFDAANQVEADALANGRVDWRENLRVANALNDAEIALYDLQRNDSGVKLADTFVDVKYVDLRQAQQLESITRGIDNGRLTNEEGETLLRSQQAIQQIENKLVNGGLTRGEYLRLQTELNNFALENADLQGNRDRYTGIFPVEAPTPATGGVAGSGNGAGGVAGSGNGSGNGAGGVAGSGNGSGNGAGGVAGSGNGSGNGAGGVAGSGNGSGNGAGGVAGSGNGSGNNAGGVAGSGNGNGPVTDTLPQTPVTEAVKPEEEKPAEAKPETVTAEDEASGTASGEPVAQPVLKALGEIRDRFGEWINEVLRDRTAGLRDLNERFTENAEKRREEAAAREENRRKAVRAPSLGGEDDRLGLSVRDADRESKVGAYVATAKAAEPAQAILTRKVA
jgi:hypothetical protein